MVGGKESAGSGKVVIDEVATVASVARRTAAALATVRMKKKECRKVVLKVM
jgi:hypothetical protein